METPTHNSALEQAATPSRSWHRRQGIRASADACQERAAPPLLSAGVTQCLVMVHGMVGSSPSSASYHRYSDRVAGYEALGSR
jgi:hypothetical protein